MSLDRVRRGSDIAERIRSDDGLLGLQGAIRLALLECVRWFEGRLADTVEQMCLEHVDTPLSALAAIVGRDPDFRRLNREIRWQRAVNLKEDIPEVRVRAHVRDGRQVREHWRLVGMGHLADIDVGDRPLRVQAVVRHLARQRSRQR